MPSRQPLLRFADIRDNAERILLYTAGHDEASWRADTLTRDAVERCLERIAEAAAKLGSVADAELPGHDWAGIRAIGNRLRHEYDGADAAILWRIVVRDLPRLHSAALIGASDLPS